jgi:hypothetical protein
MRKYTFLEGETVKHACAALPTLAVPKGSGHQVPEPATFLLFGLGLIGIGIHAKRRCTGR